MDYQRSQAGTRTQPDHVARGKWSSIHMVRGSKDLISVVVLPHVCTARRHCLCSPWGTNRSECDCSHYTRPPGRTYRGKDQRTCCVYRHDWQDTQSCPHTRADNPRRDCQCTPECTHTQSSRHARGTLCCCHKAMGSKDSSVLVVVLVEL